MSDREWLDLRWCGESPALAGEVFEDWEALLGARSPWSEMLLDDRHGEFHAVLEQLLRPGGQCTAQERAAALRRAGREHGAFRRRQGYHGVILAEELAIAEEALAAAVERAGAPPAVIAAIQDSLQPVMRAIERAMITGYVDCMTRPESTP